MRGKNHSKRRGFTIVELVIVIAVIAILAAVLIPTFSGVISNAKESAALQTARNAWKDVSYTYAAGYNGFINDTQVINGWYYDYEDGVAKYDFDGQYTVTFNGEEFSVVELDAAKSRVWNKIENSTVSFANYLLGNEPYALILSYYDGIYSRGFSWITASGITASELYIVKSNEGENADFSAATVINGTSDSSNSAYTSHKVWVTELSPATVYSYKVGSSYGWKYGVFRTESSAPASITAIQLSDAQTRDPTKLAVWENTMAQAIETAGHGLDMVLYNGDQYDSNMSGTVGEVNTSNIDRGIRNAVARETVSSYVGSIAYMPSA
ncbi:MAG: fibronectin type III domain-containing protein, partial [Clostridia bacterium]|nr:fibronectin type III domain-containing protein [Clostridia bacterium]